MKLSLKLSNVEIDAEFDLGEGVLRDIFAAAALTGVLAAKGEAAYRAADEILAARRKARETAAPEAPEF